MAKQTTTHQLNYIEAEDDCEGERWLGAGREGDIGLAPEERSIHYEQEGSAGWHRDRRGSEALRPIAMGADVICQAQSQSTSIPFL